MWKIGDDCNPLGSSRKSAGKTRALRLYRGIYTYGIQTASTYGTQPSAGSHGFIEWGPGAGCSAKFGCREDGGARQGLQYGLSGAVFCKPTWNRSPSVHLPLWGENTGRNRYHTKAIESSKRVRGRPARSSTNICQRGAKSQRPGGLHTSCRVSSQPERARHTLCLISQGDGDHYPVGHPLLGRQRAGLRSWSFASCQRSISMLGRDKAKLGLGLPPPGEALAGSPPGSEGSSENLRHIAGPGPQDYLGIRRSKL